MLRASLKKVSIKTGNIRTTYHWGAFVQPLLPCKSSKCYLFWVGVRILRYPACNACTLYLRPVRLYKIFPHYLINGTIFKDKHHWTQKRLVLILSTTLSETSLILRRNVRNMIINVYRASCKIQVILAIFKWNFKSSDRFSKTAPISNFMKLRPVGAALFHADGRRGHIWRS